MKTRNCPNLIWREDRFYLFILFFFPKKTPSISYKLLQMRLVCTNPWRDAIVPSYVEAHAIAIVSFSLESSLFFDIDTMLGSFHRELLWCWTFWDELCKSLLNQALHGKLRILCTPTYICTEILIPYFANVILQLLSICFHIFGKGERGSWHNS